MRSRVSDPGRRRRASSDDCRTGLQADVGDLGGQRFGADDRAPPPGGQLLGQQTGGALRAGDDVVGLGGEAQSRAGARRPRPAPREALLVTYSVRAVDRRERLDGAGGGLVAAEHRAVEIEK